MISTPVRTLTHWGVLFNSDRRAGDGVANFTMPASGFDGHDKQHFLPHAQSMSLEKSQFQIPLEGSSMPSEKERIWQQKRAEIDQIVDKLGHGVDEGIKEAVTALRMYDFPTNQSCEGHLEKHQPYPWIEVCAPEPGELPKGKSQEKEAWRKENLRHRQRIMSLMEEFYTGRQTSFDARLALSGRGVSGFRLQSMGAEIMAILSEAERQEKFTLYRREMDDFTAFLRQKYLSQ